MQCKNETEVNVELQKRAEFQAELKKLVLSLLWVDLMQKQLEEICNYNFETRPPIRRGSQTDEGCLLSTDSPT